MLRHQSAKQFDSLLPPLISLRFTKSYVTYIFSSSAASSQSLGNTADQTYWAKGTGFGTGSTVSNWDIDKAMKRKKKEEEDIVIIFQVIIISIFLNKFNTPYLIPLILTPFKMYLLVSNYSN